MLWASPPDGADADGRLLVDVTEFVLLVTEFLLSFVGTRAGRKLSSDIAFSFFGASCFVMMHGRLEGFQSVSAKSLFKEDIYRFRPPPQRVLAALRLQDCFNAFKSPQRRSSE